MVIMITKTIERPERASDRTQTEQQPQRPKYCLYARKSTESEERQVLSIDSQIKEMLQLAEKEGLDVAEIRRESHSAKSTGRRPIYNELLADIRLGKFSGILTWAPDRLSRNAGDLGALVDLMDQGLLHEIRTYGQKFTNIPNEKFMLMILGSTAKLETTIGERMLSADCGQGRRWVCGRELPRSATLTKAGWIKSAK